MNNTVLTVGLLKSLLNGSVPALERLLNGKSDNTELALIDENDYIAVQKWSADDVASRLERCDIAPIKENIDVLMRNGLKQQLESATDDDWYLIDNAISDCKTVLRKTDRITRSLFETMGWNMSYEEYQTCQCSTCDTKTSCIHANAHRRVPKIDDGLGLCPKLKEVK